MEIKIYVANLAAYNAGELVGEWFTLPMPMEEIFKAIFSEDELDNNGNPHGDWAIHDYEAPFKINEYDSIERLNEIAEMFERLDEEQVETIVELYEQGIITNLLDGEQQLENCIFYDCSDMAEVAEECLANQYNEDHHPLIFQYFDFERYGRDLELNSTFFKLKSSGKMVEFTN